MTSSSPAIPSSLDLSTKPILLLPKSVTSMRAGSIPRKIQITSSSPSSLKPSAPDIPTGTAPSSLITIRPASLSLSLKRGQLSISTRSNASATAKPLPPLRAQLSSFQRILNRLSPRSPPHDSQATARPHSPLLVGIEGVKIDELNHEMCFRCERERDREDVEMKRVGIHGLQWVCKRGCRSGSPIKIDETKVDPGNARKKPFPSDSR